MENLAYSDTLLIKNFSTSLSVKEKENFLKYFGAKRINIIDSIYKKKGIAFAKFESPEVAGTVLSRLHQKELLGHRLVVEFAESKDCSYEKCENLQENGKVGTNLNKEKNYYEEFINHLNSWTKGLNLKLPPPHHLKYKYPPATAEVLCNISNMLACVPKFYTQVLHLMNKMNLPCPFDLEFSLQENEIFHSFLNYICVKYGHYESPVEESTSEFESELETDEETRDKDTNLLPKRKKRHKKLIKRPKISKTILMPPHIPTTKPSINIKDVFESIDQEIISKKIEVKIPEKISVKEPEIQEYGDSGFGIIYPSEKQKADLDENKDDESIADQCITAEKLAENRIPEKDIKTLPVFKNYQAGNASCRLYIKNLSRQVTRADLLYIYNRYFTKGIDEQGTMFDIRIMQEGRMKGQAFVTLQSVKQAQVALKETNGYILKDKPMVVQFARSAPSNT